MTGHAHWRTCFRSGHMVGQAGAGDHGGQVQTRARRSGSQILCESRRVTGTEPDGSPTGSTAPTLRDLVEENSLSRTHAHASAAKIARNVRVARSGLNALLRSLIGLFGGFVEGLACCQSANVADPEWASRGYGRVEGQPPR